jgi:ribosomal protein L11 methyltransferase
MQYTEVTFTLTPYSETAADVLAALTGEIGFDSFLPAPEGVMGYIPTARYDEALLAETLTCFPMPGTSVTFVAVAMEERDWNEEWEKHYFSPIVVGERCVVHSTFHEAYPKGAYDIVINPQMAFGTGHHQTTRLMMGFLLDARLEGMNVLDMGCGTGILAILARMRGAAHADAVDIDAWCVENTRDNIGLNAMSAIDVFCGDASLLAGMGPYDVVIANINRNILLADMADYVACMNRGGRIFLSGFYVSDLPLIRAKAESQGLRYVSHRTDGEPPDVWTAAAFRLER